MAIVDGDYKQPKRTYRNPQEQGSTTVGGLLLSALERKCIEEHPEQAETIRSNCSILGMVGNYLTKKD